MASLLTSPKSAAWTYLTQQEPGFPKPDGLKYFENSLATQVLLAPELLREWNSGGRLLPSTDMFSLGMVVLRLLCHLDMEESEMLRVNNRLRKTPTDELAALFR